MPVRGSQIIQQPCENARRKCADRAELCKINFSKNNGPVLRAVCDMQVFYFARNFWRLSYGMISRSASSGSCCVHDSR